MNFNLARSRVSRTTGVSICLVLQWRSVNGRGPAAAEVTSPGGLVGDWTQEGDGQVVWTFLLHSRGEGRAEAEGRPGFSIYSRPRGFRLLGCIQQTVDKAGSWGLLRVFGEVLGESAHCSSMSKGGSSGGFHSGIPTQWTGGRVALTRQEPEPCRGACESLWWLRKTFPHTSSRLLPPGLRNICNLDGWHPEKVFSLLSAARQTK